MKTEKQHPVSDASLLSIDEWQDHTPMAASAFDNPFLGTLVVVATVACLFSWSAVSSRQLDANRQQIGEVARALAKHAEPTAPSLHEIESASGESTGVASLAESRNLDEALAGLNGGFPRKSLRYLGNRANFDQSQKSVVQDAILAWLKSGPADLPNDLNMFSIWFDSEDSRRLSALLMTSTGHEAWSIVRAMSNLPNAVPVLILELPRHPLHGLVSQAIRQELQNHDVPTDEISRQLASQLLATTSPEQFERIVLTIKNMAWETGDDPALKKLISAAMVAAGQKLSSRQLGDMDWNVAAAIKMYVELPEGSDLLTKLSATKHGSQNAQMSFGSKKNTRSDQAAVKLVRENKIQPKELLSYVDSELAQQFLWEGRLQGKREFVVLPMKFGNASLRGFSKAGVSLIDSDPSLAIDALLAVVQEHSVEITRETVSDQLLQRLDTLLASRLKDDLRLPSGSTHSDRERHPASLGLAKRLGGRQTALAIAKAGTKKPLVLKHFKGMLAAMITLNEPETHGMIVNAWAIHGDVEGLENVGEAIEPHFIARLQGRLKNLNPGDKQQRRAIHFLTSALGKIGTVKSTLVLESLAESKLVGFQKASATALGMIRERSGSK